MTATSQNTNGSNLDDSTSRSGEYILDDGALSEWLENNYFSRHHVTFLYSQTACRLTSDNSDRLFMADPGKQSLKSLKKLARKELLSRFELPNDNLESAAEINQEWTLLIADPNFLTSWNTSRNEALGLGRGTAISKITSQKVWMDAGGRCMYKGCGRDLTSIDHTLKESHKAYLAHIVASNPDGPRGNPQTSHSLSDKSDNIMLMCDEHHRLIDKIDVYSHPAPLLQEMRQQHSETVRTLLNSLSFPRAQAVAIFGSVANVLTSGFEQDIRQAILDRNYLPNPEIKHAISRTQRDQRTTESHWDNLLHEHQLDIQNFVANYGGNPSHSNARQTDTLAIFPLSNVPLLVLAGRIVGEARPVEVFQYDRHRASWRWNQEATSTPMPLNTLQLITDCKEQVDEVFLTIELTAHLDEKWIPNTLKEKIDNGEIQKIRIINPFPSPSCISHSDDLEQFTSIAREAIRLIQDQLYASKVHLLMISPASTVFRFGQLLQAGHHPTYIPYDRPDRDSPFRPTFDITGQHVSASAASGNTNINILLR